MIEVEVHQQLRAFLREQGESQWPHHLTLARLVARALRLGRSALIQAVPTRSYRSYRLGYLTPLLLWPEPAILVAPLSVQQRLLSVELPRLRRWMPTPKSIHQGDRWPSKDFRGLLMTTPKAWLSDRLHNLGHFPEGIPTVIEGADDLGLWLRQQLTRDLAPADWDQLMLACPLHSDIIRETRVQLTHSLFQRPTNPYSCNLLDETETQPLAYLFDCLDGQSLPAAWQQFHDHFQQHLSQQDHLLWTDIDRSQGQFQLHSQPLDIPTLATPLWERQPIVLIGEAMDPESEAPRYRKELGLGDLTCIQFSPNRQTSEIQLYIPENIPLPNTPRYQGALLTELRRLLTLRQANSQASSGPIVLLINDLPLKGQISAILAAEFGSRVQVEQTCLDDNSILVSGWEFWQHHQGVLPIPGLLLMATLPFPSLEHPLVAGRVAFYRARRQDWFRQYLLPQCLRNLQRAIAPVRESQGIVGLFDTRIIHRSYGQQILAALSPAARLNYLDPQIFDAPTAALPE